ncbi:MAG: TIGR02206 family membrane protein [Bacteroidetes bacterium]|jgi:hypothetical integral membrane protein (TIGR02206 family)|nr:TIGR02206 family membrane protein [Bacteroidota bacterium]HMS51065.1 TIGR02206 family membrane protein [Chitinophagales bacterium]
MANNIILAPILLAQFVPWGVEHFLTVLIWALIGFVLIYWAQKLPKRQQHIIAILLSLLPAGTMLLHVAGKIMSQTFELKIDLPLPICHFCSLAMPILMVSRRFALFEVFYFWIMVGTVQAILTPDLYDGFPHSNYWKYWVAHCGLVICILYLVFVYYMRPTHKSLWKTFWITQIVVPVSLLANYLTGGNYNYLSHKPPQGSLLDFMGPWPWYILASEALALLLFYLAYLPFAFKTHKQS